MPSARPPERLDNHVKSIKNHSSGRSSKWCGPVLKTLERQTRLFCKQAWAKLDHTDNIHRARFKDCLLQQSSWPTQWNFGPPKCFNRFDRPPLAGHTTWHDTTINWTMYHSHNNTTKPTKRISINPLILSDTILGI